MSIPSSIALLRHANAITAPQKRRSRLDMGVGRAESHGCFRLANWNAEYLRQMCWVGLRVSVVP